jgi:hypothetical protein
MTQRTGITVHLRDPEGTVDYPEATSATVAGDGNLVVLCSRPGGFSEVIDQIPPDRWAYWTSWTEPEPDAADQDPPG